VLAHKEGGPPMPEHETDTAGQITVNGWLEEVR
jgi:hypothetical protein